MTRPSRLTWHSGKDASPKKTAPEGAVLKII